MSDPYHCVSLIALCNTIIKHCFDNNYTISPQRLQMVLVSINNQYYSLTGKRLLSEFPNSYGEFSTINYKCRGLKNNKITKYFRDANGNVFIIRPSNLLESLIMSAINRF